jgi:uncharacterized protein YndB with AHSA1/START domain
MNAAAETSNGNCGPEIDHAARTIRAVRVLAAPRPLVFEVFTKPEHLRRWYGPRALTMTACTVDLRPGGRYRYVLRAPDGSEHAFSGVYREVVAPERVVATWRYEPIPDQETLETAAFEDLGRRTRVSLTAVFPSAEGLAGWANAGGPAGMAETLDRLVELIAELA